MKLGICTTDFDRMPMEKLFTKIESLGLDATQLAFCTVSEAEYTEDGECEIPSSFPEGVAEAIAETARRHGISILCVNGTFNMAHPSAAVRERGIGAFEGFARAVRAVGCDMVSICTGTRNRAHLWRPHPDNDTEAAWADMRSSMRAILDIAEAEGLTLLIEIEASNVVSTPEKARRIMDEMNSPNLKVVMDGANLFHVGEASTENARPVIGHAFDIIGSEVRLAHGKDLLPGPGLEFCGAGDGIVDFGYMLERLSGINYSGHMVLHGCKSEADMPRAVRFMKQLI